MPLRALLVMILLLPAVAACAQQATAPPLLQASAPVSIGVRMVDGMYLADIEATQPAAVTLFCPIKPGVIAFTGLKEKLEVSFDQKTRLLQMSLPAGKYRLTIRAF